MSFPIRSQQPDTPRQSPSIQQDPKKHPGPAFAQRYAGKSINPRSLDEQQSELLKSAGIDVRLLANQADVDHNLVIDAQEAVAYARRVGALPEPNQVVSILKAFGQVFATQESSGVQPKATPSTDASWSVVHSITGSLSAPEPCTRSTQNTFSIFPPGTRLFLWEKQKRASARWIFTPCYPNMYSL